jgi:hypothetical protein
MDNIRLTDLMAANFTYPFVLVIGLRLVFSLSMGLSQGSSFSVPFHRLFFSKALEGKRSGYFVFSRANVAPDDGM